jgi:hypothetical protein
MNRYQYTNHTQHNTTHNTQIPNKNTPQNKPTKNCPQNPPTNHPSNQPNKTPPQKHQQVLNEEYARVVEAQLLADARILRQQRIASQAGALVAAGMDEDVSLYIFIYLFIYVYVCVQIYIQLHIDTIHTPLPFPSHLSNPFFKNSINNPLKHKKKTGGARGGVAAGGGGGGAHRPARTGPGVG